MTKQSYRKTFSEEMYPLRDHRMLGQTIFPGAAYVEMGRALIAYDAETTGASPRGIELRDIGFENAFNVEGERELTVTVEPEHGSEDYTIAFTTSTKAGVQTRHCRISGNLNSSLPPSHSLLIGGVVGAAHGQEDIYKDFQAVGMHYGSSFQCLTLIQLTTGGALGKLQLPPELAANQKDFGLHPSLFDGALQVCAYAFLHQSRTNEILVPRYIRSLTIYASIKSGASVEAVRVGASDEPRFDLVIRNPDGSVAAWAQGLVGAAMPAKPRLDASRPAPEEMALIYRVALKDAPLRPTETHAVGAPFVFVFADHADDAIAFERLFRERYPSHEAALSTLPAETSPATGHIEPGESGVSRLHELAQNPAFQHWVRSSDVPLTLVLLMNPQCRVLPSTPAGQTEPTAVAHAMFELVKTIQALKQSGVPFKLLLGVARALENAASTACEREYLALGAMLRTLTSEQHDWTAALVTVRQSSADGAAFARVLHDELVHTQEHRFQSVSYVDGRRLLTAIFAEASGPSTSQPPFDTAMTVLVSGGMGAIGRHLVDFFLRLGFGKIALFGRSAKDKADGIIRQRWPADGHRIRYYQADIADPRSTQDAVAGVVAELGPIGMVMHCAGVLRDGLFLGKEWGDFQEVLRPKLAGVENLDEATRAQPLTHFVLFSSISALFGNTGQTDYACANAYLDQFAQDRNTAVRAGLCSGRTLSVNWGLWREGGMTVSPSVERWLFETTGMTPLDSVASLRALESLLARSHSQYLVVAGEAERVERFFEVERGRAAESTAAGTTSVATTTGTMVETAPNRAKTLAPLAADAGDVLMRLTQALVIRLVAEALKSDPAQLSTEDRFESLGFDSFLVIQTARQLEIHLGRVSKSMFYEAKTLGELAVLLLQHHRDALANLLLADGPTVAQTEDRSEAQVVDAVSHGDQPETQTAGVTSHDEGAEERTSQQKMTGTAPVELAWIGKVRRLSDSGGTFGAWLECHLRRWGDESALAAAREDIAPYVFLANPDGVFFFNAVGQTWLVFSYCGAKEAFEHALQVLQRHAVSHALNLQLLLGEAHAGLARNVGFTTTRFGVLQVLPPLEEFTLAGSKMRRLRYMCEKVRKSGSLQVMEKHAPFSDNDRRAILTLVDQWCEMKKRVNPYLLRIRAELENNALPSRHRLFACYLDGRMINAIVITEIANHNGYLMDLEFYGPDMSLGGLDCAICDVVEQLKREGAGYFSLGATFGTLFGECKGTDPDALAALQEMHSSGVLNNDGNFQFKNKYRPDNSTIYICRNPTGDSGSLAEALLLFGNPNVGNLPDALLSPQGQLDAWAQGLTDESETCVPVAPGGEYSTGNALEGWTQEVLDLHTDSWGELDYPFVSEHPGRLALLPIGDESAESALRSLFPYSHLFVAPQGRQAEALLYKGLKAILPAGKRVVLQNMLFPTQVYHLLDQGFEPIELTPDVDEMLDAQELFADAFDVSALQARCERGDVALVMFELSCNAVGGRPTRLGRLREISQICRRHAVPFFLDATRILENAAFIQKHEAGQGSQTLGQIVADLCKLADGICASLGKDFSLPSGAVLACNDPMLGRELARLQTMHGRGLSRQQCNLLARALFDASENERRVRARMNSVREMAERLAAAGIPVCQPVGGHCILLDADPIPRFAQASSPAEAYVAWLEREAGVNAAPHLGSTVRRNARKHLVRIAIPVGLPSAVVDAATRRLLQAHRGLVVPASGLSTPVLMTKAPEPAGSPVIVRDLAVVGLAFRCAGADDVDAFWRMLADGATSITEVPPSRWDFRKELGKNGKPATRWGGFINDVDCFDSLFFRISPREAELMDPQERLFLQSAWAAIEDAGYSPAELKRVAQGRVGVFVGVVWSLYHTIGHEEHLKGNPVAPNSFHWSIANRVSYVLDVRGPSMAVDTACSSSLTALHLACESIRRGECEMALVGGVNLDLHPSKPRVTNMGKVLSERGRCAAFGADADGYVPGEGVGTVIVKPLDKARADGDHIYCVVKATDINHGGRTNGYSVPSPAAQSELIGAALAKPGIPARSISYIEAHGTGTELGDPIEVAGLTAAFRQQTNDLGFCAIGSVKSNIGHLEAAAGIAGVIKVILQMQRRELVPSLHTDRLNPSIDFDSTPFFVQRDLSAWCPVDASGQPLPLRAGISSFGAGGANAHAILEEAPVAPDRMPLSRTELIVLSARTADQLLKKARDLARWIEQHRSRVNLLDIAFTLALGRAEFDCRLALTADDADALVRSLLRIADTGTLDACASAVWGNLKGEKRQAPAEAEAQIDDWICGRRLDVLARYWVDGGRLDWFELFRDAEVRRLPLPAYPFEKVRHWVSAPAPGAAAIHPLIDVRQETGLYRKRFKADEFVLADHLVAGHHTLPGVAYIEMACAAADAESWALNRVSNMAWLQPIILAHGELEVQIRLTPQDDHLAVSVVTSNASSGTSTTHAQCVLYREPVESLMQQRLTVDLHGLRKRLTLRKERGLVYQTLRAMGMEHRDAFQVLGDLDHDGKEGLAAMTLPQLQAVEFGRYRLHPSLMDGALQAAAVLVKNVQDGTGIPDIPFVIKDLLIHAPVPPHCFAYVRLDPRSTASVRRFNIDILDEQGASCVTMQGFSVRAFKAPLRKEETPTVTPVRLPGDMIFYSAEAMPVLGSAPPLKHLPMLLFTDERTDLDAAANELPGAILVFSGGSNRSHDARHYEIDWTDADCVQPLFAWLRATGREEYTLQIHYHAADCAKQEVSESRVPDFELVRRLALLLRNLPRPEAGSRRRVSFSYLQHVGRQAALVASMRSLTQESSRVDGASIGLSNNRELAGALRALAAWPPREQPGFLAELEMRDSLLYAWRYRDISHALPQPAESVFGVRKSYLISGGAGGIGRALALYLAQRYQARLTLIGRRPEDADIAQFLEELNRLGGQACYVQADVCRSAEVEAAVAHACERFGGLHGVIHCAGLNRDNLARNKTEAEFAAVVEPKVLGVENLDAATAHLQLDVFTAFSSIASALGNLGQVDYAAANRYLDLYCLDRATRRAGKTLSLRWPMWSDGGMRVADAAWERIEQSSGMRRLLSTEALLAFESALASRFILVGLVAGTRDTLSTWLGLNESLPEYNSIAQDAANMSQSNTNALSQWVTAELMTIAAHLLKLKPSDLDSSRDMSDYGIDSVMLTEFTNEVNKRFALDLSPIAFFEFPDLQGLARHMVEEFQPQLTALAPVTERTAAPTPKAVTELTGAVVRTQIERPAKALSARSRAEEPIAIVGLHGRLPGSNGLDDFWNKLVAGEPMLSEIPPDRFDWREFVGDPQREINRISSKWGGFIDDIDKFDPLFFKLSPIEAGFMDPQQRVFLETVWHTIEDAGYKPSELANSQTGLFVGLATNDYIELLQTTYPQVETYVTTGNAHSVLPNRISYLLNLRGPSEPIDTACSSSLVAIHRAVQSIRTGDCEQAIAGGVGLMMTPTTFISFSRAGMLSRDGLCKTFDKDANGYVRGEGTAAVLLKPLDKAIADGDHIYAVIRGSAINHGGYATSLTAPNPNAQAEVIIEAYRRAGVDMDAVGYIEAHGTGTPLGDPVEITGLKKAFKTLRAEQGKGPASGGQCGIGSVKSNIGHLEAAAGIAGLVKAVLAMQHKVLPPTQHVREVNPYIDLGNTPFFLTLEAREWKQPQDAEGRPLPRCAGVSSFGFGGVNAHVVLEEYVAETLPTDTDDEFEHLLVLSGKTEAALRQTVANLAEYLNRAERSGAPRLADIAYTLQVGRESFACRLAFKAATIAEAIARCLDFLDGKEGPGVFHGTQGTQNSRTVSVISKSAAGRQFIQMLMSNRDMETLGQIWVDGMDIDFAQAYPQDGRRRRVSLPGYPFARERYWIPYEDVTEDMAREAVYPRLHCRSFTVVPAHVQGAEVASHAPVSKAPPSAQALHPMLDAHGTASPDGEHVSTQDRISYRKHFSADECFLADHRLHQVPLLPAAGYLEMAGAMLKLQRSAPAGAEVRQVVWHRPIRLDPDRAAHGLDVVLEARAETGGYAFDIRDAGALAQDENSRYASGHIAALAPDQAASAQADVKPVAPISRRELCTVERDADEVYHGFSAIGLDYGTTFRTVLQLHGNDEEAVGVIELPAALNADFDRFLLHPALIDGALQCIDGLTNNGEFDTGRLSVPYSLERLVLFRALPRKLIVHVALRQGLRQAGIKIVDIQLFDVNQVLVGLIEGFSIRALARTDGLSSAGALVRTQKSVIAPPYAANVSLAADRETVKLAPEVESKPQQVSAQELAEKTLVELVAQALKIPAARVGLDTSFDQFGIDSLSISRLSTSLEQTFGTLPKTLFFEYNNLRELAGYFAQRHAEVLQAAAPAGTAGKLQTVKLKPIEPKAVEKKTVALAERDWTALSEQLLLKVVAEALKIPQERVSLGTGFDQYGIDSLSISRLTTRLEEIFGNLPKTLFFEYNNLQQMASLFASKYRDALSAFHGADAKASVTAPEVNAPMRQPALSAPEPASTPLQPPLSAPQPNSSAPIDVEHAAGDIAIIGISGRYPQAEDLQQYWDNLSAGIDCIKPVPAERWDSALHDDGKGLQRWGGFIRDVDRFDSLFFNISPREARALDPNERMFLETAWSAIEDAGYRVDELGRQAVDSSGNAQSVGVFVGVMWGQYAHLGVESWSRGQHVLTTSTYWSIANRVSYTMNFQGPSMAVDTACSSSLTAIHMACESLRRGECATALAGGVNLNLHPIKYQDLGSAGFLSSDGRCRSFGEGGDGYVPGEGVGAVLLKRLADALRDGDHIHAVIKGSAINHSGKTNGFSVPSPTAQGELIRRAIDHARVPAQSISYIEAHGTGTALGDPIELVGLTRGFGSAGASGWSCPVGSVKSNIGHLEAAAGVAALTKVVLQMRHGMIAPSLHSQRLNPNLALDDSAFFIPQHSVPWNRPLERTDGKERTVPRRAGISSFGAGGSNAHLVVEEFIDERAHDACPSLFGTELILLSAREENALRESVRHLLAFLERGQEMGDLASLDRIAHTLQVGRQPNVFRLAIAAASLHELVSRLKTYLASGPDGRTVFSAQAEDEASHDASDLRTLNQLAQAWTQGASINWVSYRNGIPQRCALPTYPFQGKRHWVDGHDDRLYVGRASAPAVASAARDDCGDPQSAVKRMLMRVAAEAHQARVGAYLPVWVRDETDAEPEIYDSDVWLLLCDDGAVEDAFRGALRNSGLGEDRLIVVVSADRFEAWGAVRFGLHPGDADQAERLLHELKSQGKRPTRLINAWNWNAAAQLSSCPEPERTSCFERLSTTGVQSLFAFVRAWLLTGISEHATVLHLFQGQAGGVSPTEYGVVGFSRSLEREDPRICARVLEFVSPSMETFGEEVLYESLLRQPQDCYVKRTAGERYRQRFADCAQGQALTQLQPAARPIRQGVYLITGGMGGLGRLLAEQLAATDVSLALLGRTPPDADAQCWLDDLSGRCRHAGFFRADCTNADAMARAVADVRMRCGPITGVIHAAGVLDDALLMFKKPDAFARVLAPKTVGTAVLDAVTREEPLDFFLMLSSLASAVGSPGQTDYGSANAFLDGFAHYRNALVGAGQRRGRSIALDLPLWCEGSMSVTEDNIRKQGEAYGIVPMRTDLGIQMVRAALQADYPQVMVLSGDLDRMKRTFDVIEQAHVEPANVERASQAVDPGLAEPRRSAVDSWAGNTATGEAMSDGSVVLHAWLRRIDPQAGLRVSPEQALPAVTIHQASELCAMLRNEPGRNIVASDVMRCTTFGELFALLKTHQDERRSAATDPERNRLHAIEHILDQFDAQELDEEAAAMALENWQAPSLSADLEPRA